LAQAGLIAKPGDAVAAEGRLDVLPLALPTRVWTGIGTVGTAVLGMVLFQGTGDRHPTFLIGLIGVGIFGLKLVH